MKVLATFSGQFGDILWSLPTVREIAKNHNEVDFGIMESFESLLPLLSAQPYIHKAFAIKEWKEEGRPFGCQPWRSPWFPGREDYQIVQDLTYQTHPYGIQLANWIRRAAGFSYDMTREDLPFIQVPPEHIGFPWSPLVAVAFNEHFMVLKRQFLDEVKVKCPDVTFVDVNLMPWEMAAGVIDSAMGFLGCRSANYVLAHGLGKRVLVYEPHPSRGAPVFNCSFGKETEVKVSDEAANVINAWKGDLVNEPTASNAGGSS